MSMINALYPVARPLLFRFSPETAHHLTLRGLNLARRLGLLPWLFGPMPMHPRSVMGLSFPNPVGLAAGMDKDGECIGGFFGLGFGFLELGTVTPRPQPGNPRPRLFRLPPARAIINRMGFNNQGVENLLENVREACLPGILGINLGKNFDTPLERAVDDYLIGLRKVYAHADYVAVNLSSPNTPGLRQLQHGEALNRLLAALKTEQSRLSAEYGRRVPVAVKIAPDLNEAELKEIARLLLSHEMDGVIATNTTQGRAGVEHLRHAGETGGLSGAPLRQMSTDIIRQLAALLENRIPIIGCGGIMSPEDAVEKLQAGASLVQLYTGLIYKGPGLVRACAGAGERAGVSPVATSGRRGNKERV